ncbi:hydroxymethylglutaryl-CoA lyase [Jatrophihabitans sp. YIM 134969]
MRRSVSVVEVSPRDGLQNEAVTLSTEDKLDLLDQLLASGLSRVEVTSFVNPARVPQLADADDLCARLPRDGGASWTGLVLNDRGLDRALAAGVDEVNVVVVSTDTFSRRNQGVDTAGGVQVWKDLAGRARAAGRRVTLTLGAAFGCPFEGEVSTARVREVMAACAEVAPDEIALADTIGVGVPTQVDALTAVASDVLPGVPLRWHFHNTRNTGNANAWTAVLASDPDVPLALDASTGGIGGCPFAPAATGNIATEDLLYLLHRAGIDTGVRVEPLLDTALWIGEHLGQTVPGQLSRAGVFPPP